MRGHTANWMGIEMYFARWYSIKSSEIDHMIFSRILAYSRGIIGFEHRDLTRNPPMISKQSQKMKYERQIRKQLKGIWNEMFPSVKKMTSEKYKQMMEFKKRQQERKKVSDQ